MAERFQSRKLAKSLFGIQNRQERSLANVNSGTPKQSKMSGGNVSCKGTMGHLYEDIVSFLSRWTRVHNSGNYARDFDVRLRAPSSLADLDDGKELINMCVDDIMRVQHWRHGFEGVKHSSPNSGKNYHVVILRWL